MKRKLHGKTDTIERQIELAFHPGAIIRDGECFSFVSSLEEVAATIGKLIATDPARAATVYESFLAGCHETTTHTPSAMKSRRTWQRRSTELDCQLLRS